MLLVYSKISLLYTHKKSIFNIRNDLEMFHYMNVGLFYCNFHFNERPFSHVPTRYKSYKKGANF